MAAEITIQVSQVNWPLNQPFDQDGFLQLVQARVVDGNQDLTNQYDFSVDHRNLMVNQAGQYQVTINAIYDYQVLKRQVTIMVGNETQSVATNQTNKHHRWWKWTLVILVILVAWFGLHQRNVNRANEALQES